MLDADTERSLDKILSNLRVKIKAELAIGTLTPASIAQAATRSDEVGEDVTVLLGWLGDPEHPENPGIARTLRRAVPRNYL